MFVSGNKLALILVSALITILNIGCTTSAITGDVYYRERIALPPGAKITVMLEDVSRADTAAKVATSARRRRSGISNPIIAMP